MAEEDDDKVEAKGRLSGQPATDNALVATGSRSSLADMQAIAELCVEPRLLKMERELEQKITDLDRQLGGINDKLDKAPGWKPAIAQLLGTAAMILAALGAVYAIVAYGGAERSAGRSEGYEEGREIGELRGMLENNREVTSDNPERSPEAEQAQ